MSRHVCKRAANRTHRHTHWQTKTQASTQTHTKGLLIEGPAPSGVVPVDGDLGHTAASSARHIAGKRWGKWGDGKRERLRGRTGLKEEGGNVKENLEKKKKCKKEGIRILHVGKGQVRRRVLPSKDCTR